MRAIDNVKTLESKYPQSVPFDEALKDYQEHGWVIDSADHFMMCKAVEYPGSRRAWFVYGAAGKLKELLKLFPCPMPFIAFCRRGSKKLHIYPMDVFTRKANALC